MVISTLAMESGLVRSLRLSSVPFASYTLGAHYILGFDWSPSKDLDFIFSRPCVFSQVGSGPASIPRDT